MRSDDLVFETKTPVESEQQFGNVVRISAAGKLGRRVVRETSIESDETRHDVLVDLTGSKSESDSKMLWRAAVITELVDTFADHDFVLQSIAKHRTKRSSPNSSDLKSFLMNSAGMYDMISLAETEECFKQINAGVELFESGIDLDNLTPQQEKTVLELVAARQILLVANLRLVSSVANHNKYKSKGMDDVDLIEEGVIGLTKAIDRYSMGRGTKFSTYAHYWIVQGITRAIADQSRTIRMPSNRHIEFMKISKQLERLPTKLGREPSDEDILHHTGLTSYEVHKLMQEGVFQLQSLDSPSRFDAEAEEGSPMGDLIGTNDADLHRFESDFSSSKLIEEMFTKAELTDRQKMVIGLHYGLNLSDFTVELGEGKEISYSEANSMLAHLPEVRREDIGQLFGVGRGGIQKIEMNAFDNLKRLAKVSRYKDAWKSIQIS